MLQDREINGLLFYYDADKDECILPSLKDDSVLVIGPADSDVDNFSFYIAYYTFYNDERPVTATISPRYYEVPDVVQYLRSQGLTKRLGFEPQKEDSDA